MGSDEPSGTQVTVLVVAPESDRATLRRMFEHSRWTLVEAETVAEAADTLRQRLSLVLICEANLPDGTWVELLNHTSSSNVDKRPASEEPGAPTRLRF